MKIKKILKTRLAISLFTYMLKGYLSMIFKLCKIHIHIDKQALEYLTHNKLCIISLWHSRLFLLPKFMQRFGQFGTVISSHGDGEILESTISAYGHIPIRGSSRHKGISAMIGIIKSLRAGNSIALTPDGPIGPRFKVKGNITAIANKFHIPILPVCYSASKAKVLKTWDRFIIPFPLISEIFIEIGKPISSIANKRSIDDAILERRMLNQVKLLDKKTRIQIDY